MGLLTDRSVKAAKVGKHGDGDGLWLIVSKTERRTWVLRYQMSGRRRDLGLGVYPSVSLSQARIAAADARKAIAAGIDPIEERRLSKKKVRAVPTFADVAALVVADVEQRTTNEKVKYQWSRHLGPAYCASLLSKPLNEITTSDIVHVLKPVWFAKPEVARKLYPAIRKTFEYGAIHLYDTCGIELGRNPAAWGNLKALGFKQPPALTKGHFPSLPYGLVPSFLGELRQRNGIAARALEFLILTAARSKSVRLAKWAEINFEKRVWIIPIENLKDKNHRKVPMVVPLAEEAISLLKRLRLVQTGEFVFAGSDSEEPLSDAAMEAVIKRMAGASQKWIDPVSGRRITVHGFRSSFRTWAEEQTDIRESFIEEAIGHTVGTPVQRAYRRPQSLDPRRFLFEEWARWCVNHSVPEKIVPLFARGA